MRGAQEDSKRYQQQSSPEGMRYHADKALAFTDATRYGVRHRNTHQKGEARLNGVMQRHAGPCNMRLVEGEYPPEHTVGIRMRHGSPLHYLSHHQQHDQSAV